MTLLTRRRFLRAALGLGAGGLVLGGAGVAQAYRFGVTRETLALPGLRAPLTVAFLTDLHYGPFIGAGSVRAWVQAANAARPDLILIGGDFMDYFDDGPPTALLDELAALSAPLGVYGVWGNHDYASFGQYATSHGPARANWRARREEMRAAFAQAGVTVLRDENRAVRDDLHLIGTDDHWRGEPNLDAAMRGTGDRATLLLTHNPDFLDTIRRPVGLGLCGHTHGGQVRLPLIGALTVPANRKFTMGWVQSLNGTPGYVSRGLGVTGLPARNLCDPELLLLTLTP